VPRERSIHARFCINLGAGHSGLARAVLLSPQSSPFHGISHRSEL
jgi:hypothetical protein